MEFLIKRTSKWGGKPYANAVGKRAVYVDRRTVKTLKEAREKAWGKEFFDEGTNHREENGMVARDLSQARVWTINIDSLQELLELVKKEGNVIVAEEDSYKGFTHRIEIYDDFRE